MLAVKPLSQFRWSRHWAVTLSRWPCLLHPCTSVGGGRKEPMTLFEKSRGRRPRCHGLSDLCRHRSGWARCDQNMDWSGSKSAPLHADVRSHLSGSSTIQPFGCKWGKLAPYHFVLIAWEWRIISISKAEHLTSSWGLAGNSEMVYHMY